MTLNPMTLDPKLVVWLMAGLLALVILARMMDRRRLKLAQMLQVYVGSRVQWSKKRAAATRLAQQMAHKKGTEESNEAGRIQVANATGSLQSPAAGPSVGPVKAPSAQGGQVKAA